MAEPSRVAHGPSRWGDDTVLTQAGATSAPLVPERRLSLSGRALLAELHEAMATAQAEVAAQRRPPSDANLLAIARSHHVLAMIAYEEALKSLHLPVPPRLRDDLRLLRRVVRN
ncbi:hypothetical protein [Pedococcus bigeumensis]|uniref:hypothetical protein n=1 Tax=Pedococcus bigeumensis TaxID=433644 RepID=UPI00112685EF|nr:hypothetical protein [Pedococcus bigeumensis]